MPNFAILLAPSEGKQPGGNPFAPDMFDYRTSGTFNYFEDLNPERRALIDTLHTLIEEEDEETLGAVFGAEGPELDEAIEINAEIYDAPLMSAMDRYSPGIMYAAMDFANLPTGAQRRLLENGIIFSGLFGLLRPDDLIPNYRLAMDAEVPGLGPMYEYWHPHLSAVLEDTLSGRFIWDLLPDVHSRAWEDTKTYTARAQVTFKDKSGAPVEGPDLGILRGQLVNFIVRETAESVEALEEWENPEGYRYSKRASSFDEEAKLWSVVMKEQ